MKTCSKCGIEKNLSDFHKHPTSSQGRRPECKACRNELRRDNDRLNPPKDRPGYREFLEAKYSQRRRYLLENPDAAKAKRERARGANAQKMARWRSNNPERDKEINLRYRATNPDSRLSSYARYNANNADKRALQHKIYRAANKHVFVAKQQKRNAAKLRACPPWADLEKIKSIYAEAARITLETGIRHEVDHIVPLQHELVCGLHVHQNMQILSKLENIKKSNRFEVC